MALVEYFSSSILAGFGKDARAGGNAGLEPRRGRAAICFQRLFRHHAAFTQAAGRCLSTL